MLKIPAHVLAQILYGSGTKFEMLDSWCLYELAYSFRSQARKSGPMYSNTQVDHMFGSKWLNNELFRLGFAVSYSEVNRIKQAVVVGKCH